MKDPVRLFDDRDTPTMTLVHNMASLCHLYDFFATSFEEGMKANGDEDEDLEVYTDLVNASRLINHGAARLFREYRTRNFYFAGFVITNFFWIMREVFLWTP